MQKKSLDEYIGIEDYNKKIFNKSMQLVYYCKKININQLSLSIKNNQQINHLYRQLNSKLQNLFKIFRYFTDTQKPTFNNNIQLAKQILQEIKLSIQIQFKKIQQQNNTLKKNKKQQDKKQFIPQSIYPSIKIYQNYDQHFHQNYLQDGIIPQLSLCLKIQPPTDLNTPYTYIDTIQKLSQAIKQIKLSSELAVDVQHSMKSYQGFTCLIQLSTRTQDYIVDVFPIWTHVTNLQEVIGNPNILKVMHGAQMDTKWLQRDFNIHIINLFDTHKASRVLGMPKFSYAYLLNHYFSVITNKIYQRADWRERPLSLQMLKYARMDTHYLLSIYDKLRIDLEKQSKSMNLSPTDVFKDIQRSSHQVTLSNVELFSYTTKQLYINLEYELKDRKQYFKIIQQIFTQLNYISMKYDINFDQLINKKYLMQIISYIKDIIFNQSSKISIQSRIQKIIQILSKQNHHHHQILNNTIDNIKLSLFNTFCHQNVITSHQLTKNNILTHQNIHPKILQQQIFQLNINSFERQKNCNIKFYQYQHQSFLINSQKINKIAFLPITNYLSTKYGIQQVKQSQPSQSQQSAKRSDQQDHQQQIIQQQYQKQQQGKIQFKQMNPNVIYTIQDEQINEALGHQIPRKKRKQLQYQNRIKNKTGNIYDLLSNNQ